MTRSGAVEILAVPGIPLVRRDDDLVALIGEGLARGGIVPREGDVFVLAQKIVSKAEGRMVDLATVEPSTEAIELAIGPRRADKARPPDRGASAGLRGRQCRRRSVQRRLA
jgi:F420-0:gamma-glutamyl ligase